MKTLFLSLFATSVFAQTTVERFILTSYAFVNEDGMRIARPAVCLISKEIEMVDVTSIDWEDSLVVIRATFPANLTGAINSDPESVVLGEGTVRDDKGPFQKFLRKSKITDPAEGRRQTVQQIIAKLQQASRERKRGGKR